MPFRPPGSRIAADIRVGSLVRFENRRKARKRQMHESSEKVAGMPSVSIAKPRGATDVMAPRFATA